MPFVQDCSGRSSALFERYDVIRRLRGGQSSLYLKTNLNEMNYDQNGCHRLDGSALPGTARMSPK